MQHRTTDLSCFEGCTPGCECADGYFYDNGRCVPVEQCRCYHEGIAYNPGDSIQQQCNTW